MQDIAIMWGEVREYPKALEKAPTPNTCSKQSCTQAGSIAQKLQNLPSSSETQLRIQRFRENLNRTPNGPETGSELKLCRQTMWAAITGLTQRAIDVSYEPLKSAMEWMTSDNVTSTRSARGSARVGLRLAQLSWVWVGGFDGSG